MKIRKKKKKPLTWISAASVSLFWIKFSYMNVRMGQFERAQCKAIALSDLSSDCIVLKWAAQKSETLNGQKKGKKRENSEYGKKGRAVP